MNLQFISPAYLLGLFGVSLPVLIHLMTRRKRTYIKFSAVYLLEQSQKRSTKRSRPNHLLLLAIRSLAIACLSLSLANPIFSIGASESTLSVPSANVVIIDDSFSMESQTENSTLFSHAIKTAIDIFRNLPNGSSGTLVLTSSPNGQPLKHDLQKLAKQVELTRHSFEIADIAEALSESVRLLKKEKQKVKRIHLLTDLDKNGWNPEHLENLVQSETSIELKIINFAPLQTRPNRVAVESVEIGQSFLGTGSIIKIKSRVRNLQKTKVIKNMRISLWVDGKKKEDKLINIPRQSVAEKEFSFLLEDRDTISGYVEIEEDGLLPDNRRHFTFQPGKKLRALVIDGDPKAVAHQSETFYIERAINPFYNKASDIEPSVATLSELSSKTLDDYSAIILCNVRELPPGYEMEIEKYTIRGGALFIFPGDQIDVGFYNEKMGNLLPVTLESLNQVVGEKDSFHFDLGQTEHQVLSVFDEKTRREMENISFHTLYSVKPRVDHKLKVPVRFKNQLPAVVEGKFGKGTVLFFASSADRDWNDFPIKPTFLPWIQRWIKYTARNLDATKTQKLFAGDPFQLDHKIDGSIYIRTPEGPIYVAEKTDSKKNKTFDKTSKPGIYQIFVTKNGLPNSEKKKSPKLFTLPPSAELIRGFSVNVNPDESKPEKIKENEIREFLKGWRVNINTSYDYAKKEMGSTETPLTSAVLFLVAFALFYEGWLVRRD